MMMVASVTGGKFLPLGKADTLAKVIVATTVEGIEMEELWTKLGRRRRRRRTRPLLRSSSATWADPWLSVWRGRRGLQAAWYGPQQYRL
jgi:hypothetical protein